MKLHYLAFSVLVFFASTVAAAPKKGSVIKENKFIKDLDEIYIGKLNIKNDISGKQEVDEPQTETIISENLNPLYDPKYLPPLKSSQNTLFNIRWWSPTEAEKLYMHPSQSIIKDQLKLEKLDRHNSFEKMHNKSNHKKHVISY